MSKKNSERKVDNFSHEEYLRKNIPAAEYQAILQSQENKNLKGEFEIRNKDLDPQLIWQGKDINELETFIVNAPPIYIQEKIHPKALIDDIQKRDIKSNNANNTQIDLFSIFDNFESDTDKTEFYLHDQNWSNRMILGDSLQVMASLAKREGLNSKVQAIYFDPPYGIKFNSNFQWSTSSRDGKDGNLKQITREPEQVKAFRDTWRNGIHSYLSYIKDRLIVARELLKENGSIFLQIGDENVHRLRAVLDEVFGADNFVAQITVVKNSALFASSRMPTSSDYILWYAKDIEKMKYRKIFKEKDINSSQGENYRYLVNDSGSIKSISKNTPKDPNTAFRIVDLTKPGPGSKYEFSFQGKTYQPGKRWWGTTKENLERVSKAGRITITGKKIGYLRAWNDFSVTPIDNVWTDTGTGGFLEEKIYVVQTTEKIIQRCLLMTTDPGDLVLDPTCGSGTTASVCENWGRRWITIDTSRVALALARARLMGSRYPYYLIADSYEGREKEAQLSNKIINEENITNSLRSGFVYKRAPYITLKSIANNKDIDFIYAKWKPILDAIKKDLNTELNSNLNDWEIEGSINFDFSTSAKQYQEEWIESKIKMQNELNQAIAAKADYDFFYDQPFVDNGIIRVAGPFTVESLSPHRTLIVDENDVTVDPHKLSKTLEESGTFDQMILETLKYAGVQQTNKDSRIIFESLVAWPGNFIAGKGNFLSNNNQMQTAGIFIGPEFGTVSRLDLLDAAKEAANSGFDVLISCAFNYEAHSTILDKFGSVPILKARMNADLHMQQDLKGQSKGNLFHIFGEPDIEIVQNEDNLVQIVIKGVDVFDPSIGEVRSDEIDSIACWFIDTNYNGESFFVRHAYFLGQGDPYKNLKISLKSEINKSAWDTLNSDRSQFFEIPKTRKIAVKVINHLGDEVMKIFKL